MSHLRIFRSELRQIAAQFVLDPTHDTGGGLYGLWTRAGNPVVYLVTHLGHAASGPERPEVDRATSSLLERHLWQEFGMQNVGDWFFRSAGRFRGLTDEDVRRVRERSLEYGIQKLTQLISFIDQEHDAPARPMICPFIFPNTRDGEPIDSEIVLVEGASPLRSALARCNLPASVQRSLELRDEAPFQLVRTKGRYISID